MNGDSGFDSKEFTASPYLKLIKDKEGATCMCYQMRLHGKLHFVKKIPSYIKLTLYSLLSASRSSFPGRIITLRPGYTYSFSSATSSL